MWGNSAHMVGTNCVISMAPSTLGEGRPANDGRSRIYGAVGPAAKAIASWLWTDRVGFPLRQQPLGEVQAFVRIGQFLLQPGHLVLERSEPAHVGLERFEPRLELGPIPGARPTESLRPKPEPES